MGTSSLYKGPKHNPLLPDDYNDNPNNAENPIETPSENSPEERGNSNENDNNSPSKTWSDAKRSMSRHISGKSSFGIRKPISDYVKTRGGATNATKTSRSGVKTTSNIITFFGGIINSGVSETLEKYHITTEGKNSLEILNEIVNNIAPVPIDREDAISREALIETMSEVYASEQFDISSLDSFNAGALKQLVQTYVYRYIYAKIINDLGNTILTKGERKEDVIRIEAEIRVYIKNVVNTTIGGIDINNILSADEIKKNVTTLYKHCYQVMEDQL